MPWLGEEAEMKVRNLEVACKAAKEHGRKDFLAGSLCDPSIPLNVYDDLTPEQQIAIMESWVNGWKYEEILQSLPDVASA
jgi:hypothetical protein